MSKWFGFKASVRVNKTSKGGLGIFTVLSYYLLKISKIIELSELTIVEYSGELVRFMKFSKMVLSVGTQVYSNIRFSLCRDQSEYKCNKNVIIFVVKISSLGVLILISSGKRFLSKYIGRIWTVVIPITHTSKLQSLKKLRCYFVIFGC